MPVPELKKPLSLLQITDAHLTRADERDTAWTHEMQPERERCFYRYPDADPEDLLEAMLEWGIEQGVDAVVLTGDILDYPTKANLEMVEEKLGRLPMPYLFTTGNHDWSHLWIDRRAERRPEDLAFLAPLMDGSGVGVLKLPGVTLAAVDDSTYQVSAKQYESFIKQAEEGTPMLVFLHIPLYLETLVPETVRVWKQVILTGCPGSVELSERGPSFDIRHDVPPAAVPTKDTASFVQQVQHLPNICGVFTGHLHFSHEDRMPSGAMQYVTAPAFEGGARLIELIPG